MLQLPAAMLPVWLSADSRKNVCMRSVVQACSIVAKAFIKQSCGLGYFESSRALLLLCVSLDQLVAFKSNHIY